MPIPPNPSGPTHVRWRVVSLLAGFSLMAYVVRVNITVAAEPIMHEFGLSPVHMGWVFTAFLLSYTVLNMPSGAWADRWGPRRLLGTAGLSWFALTVVTAWLPGRVFSSVTGILGTLLALRLLLGVCEAPTYSSTARSIADWLPVPERALANGLVMGAALLGSAVTGPAFSALMVRAGWRTAMAISSLPVPLLVVIWWVYARDHPQQHRQVSLTELETITMGTADEGTSPATGAWKDLLRSRQAWTLSAIYGCQTYLGYLFIWWCYIYLVEVRHFSLVRGGFASAAPFVLATFTTPAGGALSDRMIAAFGWRRGVR